MRNLTIYLSLIFCLYLSKTVAQDTIQKNKYGHTTFEYRAKIIAAKIDAITKEEKDALKAEVEAVNVELDKKAITNEEADARKLKLAETRARNIETRVAVAEAELSQLVKDRVDGKLKDSDSTRTFIFTFNKGKRAAKELNGETRTTSQFVFAAGLNNLVTDNALAHSDYRYWGSHFYEWGVTWNTRIMKENNLLHAKYGLSLMYNNLRPTDNRYFVENGNQTDLETAPINLRDSRMRNVYIAVPLHLEFDFSKKETKDGKTLFKTHEAFRFGLGGYAGVNVKSKQILRYEDSENNNVTQKTKGDFNVNDFIYGVSAYIGYEETSLYIKYDLNPLFKDNAVDQNNISLGIRFDLN